MMSIMSVAKKRMRCIFFGLFVMFVLHLFFIAPFVSAKIVILNNFRDMYNLGDTVTVDGYIVAEETASAPASLTLQCPSYSKVNSVNLKINKGQKISFATLGIADFLLPSDIEGVCDVDASFNGEYINSDSFTVLNDLLGSFDVADDSYQLGDSFSLSGIVFKLNGDDVTGTAKIYLKKDGAYAVQLDETTVSDGRLEYSRQLSGLEYGTYYVDVKVSDSAGNSQYFENVDSFSILTEISVSASSSKYQYEPGEEVVVYGDINTDLSDISSLDAVIIFDTLRYALKPTSDSFEYRFFIPANMKHGTYTVTVSINDIYGNTGSDDFIITVKQVPTRISNDIGKDTYNPGELLAFDVDMLDQTDNEMALDVSVQITDPSGAVLYNGVVNTAQTVELEFGTYSIPGIYTIVSKYAEKNLEDTTRVTLNELRVLSTQLNGETITLKNTGNVPYNDHVDIILVRSENGELQYYLLPQDVALEPGNEHGYDLSYEVPAGEYSLLVDDSPTDISQLEEDELADYVSGLENTSTSGNLYSDISFTEDNRSLSKKLDQGFSSITGATTISRYDSGIVPWFFIIVLFIFAALLCLFAYQQRAVIHLGYLNYKKKMQQKSDGESFLSSVKHRDSDSYSVADEREPGDIPEEEVQKLLEKAAALETIQTAQKTNIGTDENKKVIGMKAVGVKPGTTSLQFKHEQKSEQVQSQQKPRLSSKPEAQPKDNVLGKKKNKFSTWNPPENLLNENNFPPKNPVKEQSALERDKEKTLYDDIDEDFLRDEKF